MGGINDNIYISGSLNISGLYGIVINDNQNDQGYIRTDINSTAYEFKIPHDENIYRINNFPSNDYDLMHKHFLDQKVINITSAIDN